MNFTREPIIETIITAKDGNKLTLRNSKGGSSDEYSVDAIEVVSFGASLFFRSLERPKSFLLPVTDYEVIESKETRVVLKNAPLEKSIKIGGGRTKNAKEAPSENSDDSSDADKPKRKKTTRKRKVASETKPEQSKEAPQEKAKDETPKAEQKPKEKQTDSKGLDNSQVSSSMFKSLLPPPPTLIKREEVVLGEKNDKDKEVFVEDSMEKPTPQEKKEEVKEAEAEKKTEAKSDDQNQLPPSSGASAGDETPRYHAIPGLEKANEKPPEEKKEEEKSPEEDKTEKSSIPFNAENKFAF